MSIQDIFKYVENYSKELKKKLDTSSEVVETIKQGALKDEKKEIIEESK